MKSDSYKYSHNNSHERVNKEHFHPSIYIQEEFTFLAVIPVLHNSLNNASKRHQRLYQ